jgi:2Fe-2S ferredoxin
MPKITVLPHPEYAPAGAEFTTEGRTSLCDALLDHGIEIEHACGKVGACTTCHVIVREGFDSLNPPGEDEEDMLDRAWGLQPQSRLSCQAIVASEDLVVEIPMYSINLEKEKAG